jgi:hypothetical protein
MRRWSGVGWFVAAVALGCGPMPTQAVAASEGSTGAAGSESGGMVPTPLPGTDAGPIDGGAASGPGDPTGSVDSGDTSGGFVGGSSGETAGGGSSTGFDPGGSSSESTAAAPFDPCVDSLPEVAPAACTVNIGATTFSLTNNCASRRFRLIWIPGSCEESASVFDVLDPGDVSGWNTSVGAVWRVRDEDTGELVMDLPPLGPDEMLTIP